MKAFLLAAGHGTRLRPLTDSIPKCLVPIRGVPMLRVWLELCARHGISEVLVNLHSHSGVVRGYLESQGSCGVNVRLSDEPQLLGSAGTIAANREWIEDDESFWIFYADVLTNTDLSAMLAFHREKSPIATLGVKAVPDPTRCGIVTLDSEQIVQQFVEKPKNPASNLAFSGLMLATTEIFAYIPEIAPSDIGFHLLPKLVGSMAGYPIREYLIDIGTIENYGQAQQSWPGWVEETKIC